MWNPSSSESAAITILQYSGFGSDPSFFNPNAYFIKRNILFLFIFL
jgi:hypothetical protein